MAGYLCVQSSPLRVSNCTRPRSSRACIRYPSNLISCSQSFPAGASFTSSVSCGSIQVGNSVVSVFSGALGAVRRPEERLPMRFSCSASTWSHPANASSSACITAELTGDSTAQHAPQMELIVYALAVVGALALLVIVIAAVSMPKEPPHVDPDL